ncbi:MAG: phosphodiester glycosidase family protein, partial [Nitrospinaceae bacterium]|nr:phosphodiester glycosidase family protein [Nitrospinaceae bacterium]NIR55674.1 phosphodiester glycosidase family protein [Nitrospinaceae bacterium]NIS86118.1 phosphodiester glycosidase family protein [Nitrospinaceae bacterium]NIT82962.1 phosphodiester glycosidase family protein [Nitrospinaceae bacterium]NIU45165.1 phosphodiester glycosidase family protein [Nitrospinaceae bacterium]
NASAPDQGRRLSVRDWVRRNGLVAGINASMYQKDMRTSVSLMKTGNHVNSSWVSKDKTLLVFDPQDADLPPVQLVDRDCEDFDQIRKQYRTLIQSIRMVSCRGENVWAQQPN